LIKIPALQAQLVHDLKEKGVNFVFLESSDRSEESFLGLINVAANIGDDTARLVSITGPSKQKDLERLGKHLFRNSQNYKEALLSYVEILSLTQSSPSTVIEFLHSSQLDSEKLKPVKTALANPVIREFCQSMGDGGDRMRLTEY